MVEDHEMHAVAASCFIYDRKAKFLIIRRSPYHSVYPDIWAVPMGKVSRTDFDSLPYTSPNEGWEDPIDIALRREILEETGLVVGEFKYQGNFSHIRPDGVSVIGIRFAALYKSGQIRLNQEHVDYRWISAEEVDSYNLLGVTADVIRRIDERLGYPRRKRTVGRAA